jgi:hypothetical protein
MQLDFQEQAGSGLYRLMSAGSRVQVPNEGLTATDRCNPVLCSP